MKFTASPNRFMASLKILKQACLNFQDSYASTYHEPTQVVVCHDKLKIASFLFVEHAWIETLES